MVVDGGTDLNYGIYLSRLVENLFLVADQGDAHVGELLCG